MRRFWIEPEKIENDIATIDGDLFHHITDVCRMQEGDRFELLSGQQQAYFVKLGELKKKSAQAEVIETRQISPLPKPHIILAISVPKFQTFETILEKCVELGVYQVVPFVSDFSFIRDAKKAQEKVKRWDKIIRSATQQSGRGDVMRLNPIEDLKSVLKHFNQKSAKMGLFAYEGLSEINVQQALESTNSRTLEETWVFVGSEGGFSTGEVEYFKNQGLSSMTLGSQVLRVETACLAMLSIIKYQLGLMK